MKLKDILARELKVWPTDAIHDHCVQSDETTQVFFDAPHGEIFLSERADEAVETKVTRAEWQAAVEALKAEQAAELKWPDGATHFTPKDSRMANAVFYKVENGKAVIGWPYYNGKIHYPSTGMKDGYVWETKDTIPRPTERAVEWDRASLPPVGAVCEHFGTAEHTNWIDVQVIGHGNVRHHDVAFFEYMAGTKGYTVSYSTANNFRPTRTQEQIAAEERMAAAYAMCAIAPSLSNVDAVALYDALYRKQVVGIEELASCLEDLLQCSFPPIGGIGGDTEYLAQRFRDVSERAQQMIDKHHKQAAP